MPRLPNTPASEVEAMVQREWMICPGCGQDVQTIAAEGIPAQALRACKECGDVFWMDLNSRPRLKPLKQNSHRRELRTEIRELKREMKELGIKRTSCFNGGLDATTYRYNARLFELTTRLNSPTSA